MRALITGASGFVGGHLAKALAPDHDVVAFRGDVRDASCYPRERFDVVFHLAAQSNVPRSIEDPAGTWDVNANGTLRLLEWALAQRVGRVVLVSSAHVYGKAQRSPIDETHPTLPVSPYGASKLGAEALARAFWASKGLETVIVRPFNLYGPGQEKGFLVPDVLHQVREGSSLVLGDLRPVRDFTYIADGVDFLARAGTVQGLAGEAFNLGSGEGHAVREVVETALRVAGSKLSPTVDDAKLRPADMPELIVDNRKARRALGWAPHVGLEEGLRRTWEATR